MSQDELDLRATIAGLKPACFVPVGPQLEALTRGALDAGLHAIDGALPRPMLPVEQFPAWYSALRLAGEPGRFFSRRTIVPPPSRIDVAAEAALFGYPECCVAEQHARSIALERLWLDMLARVCAGDEARLRRFAAASLDVSPATQDECTRLAAALAIDPVPHTSINRCSACRALGPASPAARIGAAFAELASACDYRVP